MKVTMVHQEVVKPTVEAKETMTSKIIQPKFTEAEVVVIKGVEAQTVAVEVTTEDQIRKKAKPLLLRFLTTTHSTDNFY